MSLPVRSHYPDEKQLERFMRLDLSRPEVIQIVRHLMTGCSCCLEVTRRFWERGELAAPIPRGSAEAREGKSTSERGDMTPRQASTELRDIVAELQVVRSRLMALEADLPGLREMGVEDLESMDEATEMRSVIQCVLADSIRPAIEDLEVLETRV